MDVHDAGLYQVKGASQKLVPGMVLTVEPGTYIRPADNVPEAFWDIGVRIEDDVLVTASGIENLTVGGAEVGRGRRGRLPALMLHRCVDPIVGAGPVGSTLALALADGDLDVVVLDARARRRDAARRPLARAVARRAPHPRAARRVERARGDAGRA